MKLRWRSHEVAVMPRPVGGDRSLQAISLLPCGKTYATTGTVEFSGLSTAFTGKPFDAASRLYYFLYRYYNQEMIRWLTRDPLGMIDGPNVKAYVGNTPLNGIDPLGLDLLDNAADTAAGLGDTITGGITDWIRLQMGTDDTRRRIDPQRQPCYSEGASV